MDEPLEIALWLIAEGREPLLRNWLQECVQYVIGRRGCFDPRIKAAANGVGSYNDAIAAVWRPGLTNRTLGLQMMELAAAWCRYPDIAAAAENVFELLSDYEGKFVNIFIAKWPEVYSEVID